MWIKRDHVIVPVVQAIERDCAQGRMRLHGDIENGTIERIQIAFLRTYRDRSIAPTSANSPEDIQRHIRPNASVVSLRVRAGRSVVALPLTGSLKTKKVARFLAINSLRDAEDGKNTEGSHNRNRSKQ